MTGLSVEAMEFLQAKGLSLGDVIEFARMIEQPKIRSANAERQARFRRRRASVTADSNVTDNVTSNALRPPYEETSTPPVSSNDETRRAKPKPKPVAKPVGVSEQTWLDFNTHRKTRGGPITETGLIGIQREADVAGWTLEAALAEAVTRNWQGFKAKWVEDKSEPAANGSFLASLSARSRTLEPAESLPR